MIIYNYDRNTKEFINESVASINPLESEKQKKEVYLIPANSTTKNPPKVKKKYVLIFDEEKNKWNQIPDNRGIYYKKVGGDFVYIEEINIDLPNDVVDIQPPEYLIKPIWDGIRWLENSLMFHNVIVETKEDVDRIIRSLLDQAGEGKAKTEKMIAGDQSCPEWEEFLIKRKEILKEGNNFIDIHKLS